jgi:hypothetical protein
VARGPGLERGHQRPAGALAAAGLGDQDLLDPAHRPAGEERQVREPQQVAGQARPGVRDQQACVRRGQQRGVAGGERRGGERERLGQGRGQRGNLALVRGDRGADHGWRLVAICT